MQPTHRIAFALSLSQVDWTVMADANAALSILVPTPDDEMGVIVLDCVVRGARRWTLPMPIGEAASV